MITISVVTAVFNRHKTVCQAIESILSQSYSSVDLIVIDGSSTDGTLELLEPYRPRMRVFISERDTGIYDALNKGIKYAPGDVVGFLHADDIFENNDVLAKVAEAFQDSSVDAVYGDLVYVKEDDIGKAIRLWKSGMYNVKSFSRGWMPPHPTFYVRRSVYDRLGGFDCRYKISSDYDTILRFLAVGKIHAVYIPEVMVRMRIGGISNRSLKSICQKSFEDFLILRRNNVGGLWALILKNLRKLRQFRIR